MKGLTHFISGVAFGTFFPSAVTAAAKAKSFILVLGGVGGILPDTLDFKLARFLEEYDIEVDPDHENPDPQQIADALAEAVDRAGREGRTVRILLHTIRLGADAWRQYSVFFNTDEGKIEVRIGPVVSTSKIPYGGTEPDPERARAEARPSYHMLHTYDKENKITIFSGPSFDMVPRENGAVEIQFLAWHRRWSHSFTLAALLGVVGWAAAWCLENWFGVSLGLPPWLYGLILGGGAAVHVLEDQTGFMGSNLFYPFTKERTEGLKWFHSGHPLANFTTVYLAVAAIVFNLNRFSERPPISLAWWEYLVYVVALPLGLLYLFVWLLGGEDEEEPDDAEGKALDALEESEEEGGGA